jgi:hypothetical protein
VVVATGGAALRPTANPDTLVNDGNSAEQAAES